MSYGYLSLIPKSNGDLNYFIERFFQRKRFKRNVPEIFGIEGEFYIGSDEENIITRRSPSNIPNTKSCIGLMNNSINCLGITEGYNLENLVDWIKYLAENIYYPLRIAFDGKLSWQVSNYGPKAMGIIEIIGTLLTIQYTNRSGSVIDRELIKIQPRKEPIDLKAIVDFEKKRIRDEENEFIKRMKDKKVEKVTLSELQDRLKGQVITSEMFHSLEDQMHSQGISPEKINEILNQVTVFEESDAVLPSNCVLPAASSTSTVRSRYTLLSP